LISPTAKRLPLPELVAQPPLTLSASYLVINFKSRIRTNKRRKMATTKVTTADFDSVVLKSTTPVLVDFWAEWCGPCRAVGPILEDISNEYGAKIKIVKLNTDEEQAIAMKYGISSIPTMNVFVNGEVVKTLVGAKPKPALLKDLESFIK